MLNQAILSKIKLFLSILFIGLYSSVSFAVQVQVGTEKLDLGSNGSKVISYDFANDTKLNKKETTVEFTFTRATGDDSSRLKIETQETGDCSSIMLYDDGGKVVNYAGKPGLGKKRDSENLYPGTYKLVMNGCSSIAQFSLKKAKNSF